MQSGLVVSKLNRILFAAPKYQTIPRSALSSASSGGGGPEMEGETEDTKPDDEDDVVPARDDDHYMHPKTVPPNLSSSKLESPAVNKPIDPHVQQKRSRSICGAASKEELCCAGLDGSPWPEEKGLREEQEEDDKEDFEHHKGSPLSEMEIAREGHGTGGGYFGDEKVMTWRPEQLDTAEESLRRAREMFREAAARGVPEWPHSRRLRELRGEEW